ncbi:hypothetical protein S83_066936, partial [Arachis hypogaea]
IIYYHKDTFGDKENYMGPPPPWIAYWDKEKLAKKLIQESSKQRPTSLSLIKFLVYRFDEQNNDNKMSKEDDNVSDEKKDKESDAKQDEEKEVKT